MPDIAFDSERVMSNSLPEQYVVFIDGEPGEAVSSCARGVALERALRALETTCVEIVVADARTLRVCAYWRRTGPGWAMRALDGWLS